MSEEARNFNLVTDDWIPVVMPDGAPRRVGLRGLFAEADRIRDLACNPPQRIALMRLLICITQAALDGPEDEEDWFNCKTRIAPASLAYLEKWRAAFYLRGERPFMQVPGLEVAPGKSKALDVVDFRLARENNPTLFDHSAGPEGRVFGDEQIALNLLTMLNFSCSGKVGQCIWNGRQHSQSTFAGPCLDWMVTFVRGRSLLETIVLNLMTKLGQTTGISRLPNGVWGKPVWEMFPKSTNDTDAFENAAMTYLGRLVPLSRFINLNSAGERDRCIFGPPHAGYRIQHLPTYREPWMTVVGKNDTVRYLRVEPTKHAWRELGSILSLRSSRAGPMGSLSLHNLIGLSHLFQRMSFEVWVGGLKTGSGGGKIVDMAEWAFAVQAEDLQEAWTNRYERGVMLADQGASALAKAVKAFHALLRSENVPYESARVRYWGDLDSQYSVLYMTARDPSGRLAEMWYPVVRQAMRDAYAYVCPRGTAREIEAFAQGLDRLRLKKPEE